MSGLRGHQKAGKRGRIIAMGKRQKKFESSQVLKHGKVKKRPQKSTVHRGSRSPLPLKSWQKIIAIDA